MSRYESFDVLGCPPKSQGSITAYKTFCVLLRFPKGATVEQLMESFGMARATAFRYRCALELALGIDLHQRGSRGADRKPRTKAAA